MSRRPDHHRKGKGRSVCIASPNPAARPEKIRIGVPPRGSGCGRGPVWGVRQRSPGPRQELPCPLQQLPGPLQELPCPLQQSPWAGQRSPGPLQELPGPLQESPWAGQRWWRGRQEPPRARHPSWRSSRPSPGLRQQRWRSRRGPTRSSTSPSPALGRLHSVSQSLSLFVSQSLSLSVSWFPLDTSAPPPRGGRFDTPISAVKMPPCLPPELLNHV